MKKVYMILISMLLILGLMTSNIYADIEEELVNQVTINTVTNGNIYLNNEYLRNEKINVTNLTEDTVLAIIPSAGYSFKNITCGESIVDYTLLKNGGYKISNLENYYGKTITINFKKLTNLSLKARNNKITNLKGSIINNKVCLSWNKKLNIKYNYYNVVIIPKNAEKSIKAFTVKKTSFNKTLSLSKNNAYICKVRGVKIINKNKIFTNWKVVTLKNKVKSVSIPKVYNSYKELYEKDIDGTRTKSEVKKLVIGALNTTMGKECIEGYAGICDTEEQKEQFLANIEKLKKDPYSLIKDVDGIDTYLKGAQGGESIQSAAGLCIDACFEDTLDGDFVVN